MPKKTDAHLHSWDLQKIQYSWLNKDAGILFDSFTPEKIEKELLEIGVDSAVLVQADNSWEDSQYMFEQASLFPWVKGVVAWLPLEDPDRTSEIIENKYGKNPFFKGVRHLMHIEPDPNWLLQENVLLSLQILADKKIPFDAIGINLQQLDAIIKVAEKLPNLMMMVDHLNQPPLDDDSKMYEWKNMMGRASMNGNIFVKISGLGTISRTGFPSLENAIVPVLDFILEYFQPKRCCCGSDWPISLLDTTYAETWNIYESALRQISSNMEDIEQVVQKTANDFYGIGQ
jgi:L-fuconolactonase